MSVFLDEREQRHTDRKGRSVARVTRGATDLFLQVGMLDEGEQRRTDRKDRSVARGVGRCHLPAGHIYPQYCTANQAHPIKESTINQMATRSVDRDSFRITMPTPEAKELISVCEGASGSRSTSVLIDCSRSL